MPVIKLADVLQTAVTGKGESTDTLIMRKAIGSPSRDPRVPEGEGAIQSDAMSITWIKLWGGLQRMVCHDTDRAMYIVEGDAIVQVGDEQCEWVEAGDFVYIPKGTPYEAKGTMTYLVINAPAYREGTDLRDEKDVFPDS